MIETECKAKMVDGGVWVYGYYCELAGRKYIIPDYSQFRDIYYEGLENSFTEIIQETVFQWTGLFDKKGAKIFEGDIFQYSKHDGYLLPDFTGEVLFSMGCFGYVATSENMREAFTSFSEIDELKEDFLDYIEVISNIHDKARQKQALIDMMRGDEELGLYDE